MKRVLQVIGNMNIGGMESMLMNYFRNLDKNKIVYDFMIFNKNYCDYEDEIIKLGGRIYKITPRRENILKNYKEMKTFFRKNKYDIIEIHQGVTYLLPLKLAKKNKTKRIIIHNHGIDSKYKKGVYNIIRKLFIIPYINSSATDFFSCSKLVLEDLFTEKTCEKDSCIIVNNVIDAQQFAFNSNVRNQIRNSLNIQKHEYVIGHIGNFNFSKNHEFILKIAQNMPEYKFVLVGTGKYFEKYKEQASSNVIFYGESKEVYKVIQSFDIFILPSRWEGLPLVSIEAQATGLPLILSESISIEANITGNITYLPLDLNQWINKIKELKNYKRRDTLRQIIESGFDSKTEAKKLEKIYLREE